jgi:muconolactone D-isomerase
VEFIVQIQGAVPPEIPADQLADVMEREVARGRGLKEAGTIVRIWRIPGRRANVGVWQAETPDALDDAVTSLPAFPWIDANVTPL